MTAPTRRSGVKREARSVADVRGFTDADLRKAAECFGGLWPDTSLCGLLVQIQFNVARALADERAAILGTAGPRKRGTR